jgi:hypothetical protein
VNAKIRHATKIREYIANPANPLVTRKRLAEDVLGLARQSLYKHFSPSELTQLENAALELRSTR